MRHRNPEGGPRSVVMRRIILLLLVALVGPASPTLRPQSFPPTLSVNGGTNVAIPIGGTIGTAMFAAPNVPFIIALSGFPGPTVIGPFTIPIGAPVVIAQNSIMPPNGIYAESGSLPADPMLAGITLHGVGVTVDPMQPGGIGITNGISFTFIPAVDAGLDTAGLIGDPITLDGSANSGLSETSYQWTAISGPPGHNAQIQNASTLFPTLVADVAGLYTIRLSASQPGLAGEASDELEVSVYDIEFFGREQGDFAFGANLGILSLLNGPPANLYEAVGHQTTTGTNINLFLSAGTPSTSTVFSILSPTNQRVQRGLTIINNVGSSFGPPPPASFGLNLKQPAVDDVAQVLEMLLETTDLEAAVLGQPPVNIANVGGPFGITTFSADVQLASLGLFAGHLAFLEPEQRSRVGGHHLHESDARLRSLGRDLRYQLHGDRHPDDVERYGLHHRAGLGVQRDLPDERGLGEHATQLRQPVVQQCDHRCLRVTLRELDHP